MKALVLAAGKGKRLHSEEFNLPKAMRLANGKPLLAYALDNISFIPKKDITIVVGYKKEAIIDAFNDGYVFAFQKEQLGTGHAAKSAESVLSDYDGPLLVCYGDMPLMSKNTFEIAIEKHISENNSCTLITGIGDESFAYGRIIRNADGSFKEVVELKDCSTEQKKIFEMNTGVYVFDSRKMFAALGKIKNNNAQKEYYLTDVPGIMQKEGMKIGTYTIPDKNEMLGVNTLEDLELCEKILKSK